MVCDSEHQLGGVDLINARWCQPFDYTALGHLHTPQVLGNERIRYAGSLLKYSVSEARQHKSVYLIELREKGSFSCQTISIPPLRELRTIRGKLEQILNANEISDDYIFVNLTDESLMPDAMNRLRSIFSHILGLKLENRDQEFEGELSFDNTLAKQSMDSLFADFYKQIRGEDIPPHRAELMRKIFEEVKEESI